MTDLLDLAVQAHGGMERWRQLSSIRIAASITGAIWFVKGQGDALKDVVLTVDTTTERVTKTSRTGTGARSSHLLAS
jgi:hypothetical protein